MKKSTEKVLSMTASAALKAVVVAAGIPSMGGIFQPKAPANLQEVIKNHKNS